MKYPINLPRKILMIIKQKKQQQQKNYSNEVHEMKIKLMNPIYSSTVKQRRNLYP